MECRPCTYVIHGPRIGFDHCPIILYLKPKKANSKKLFKFESSWATEPDYGDVVKQECDKGRGVLGHTRWQSSLGHCRRHLITWSKEKFLDNSVKIRELLAELSDIQDSNDSCNQCEFEINANLTKLWKREELY